MVYQPHTGEVSVKELLWMQEGRSDRKPSQTSPGIKRESPSPSPQWWLIAVILEILCLALLTTARIFDANCFKCCLCPDKWLQYGEDYYHFSNEFKIWQKSKDYCSSLASKLLQIDSKEELDFIMQELFKLSDVCQGLRYHENYWFGLSYDTAIKKWVWEDGTTLSSHLFQIPENNYKFYRNGVCPYFQGEKVLAGDRWQLGYPICEKRDRFSA
ncbi:natural killer cells antigen CD94-like [Gopherus evgoodei]|uniref:natural killer cells antigen CD94-like n=1 Tax=Gopherus evgoodei TaxID=1825980 RepID=UPI0011CF3EA9|nr:natural killer cells antigen CD94-like [Gopherus evgoodei]